ncbi:hypothetical protein MTO96_048282 [Rhipicephalus appendiculatus]
MELVIVNTTEKCKGTITWAARTNTSCIDYCLISPGLLPQLTDMHVDENGEQSIGSGPSQYQIAIRSTGLPHPAPWSPDRLSDTHGCRNRGGGWVDGRGGSPERHRNF